MKHLRGCETKICCCDEKRYRWIFLLSLLIFAVELVGGLLVNSLFVISDSLHALVDGLADAVSFVVAVLIRKNKESEEPVRSVGGFITGSLLGAAALWIFWEALRRFSFPLPVAGWGMMIVSLLAVIGNGARLWILWGAEDNVTYRAAFRHVASDFWHSVAAIAAGIFIAFTGANIIDTVFSVTISLLMLFWAGKIFSESWRLLEK